MFDLRNLNITIELWGVIFCAISILCAVMFVRDDKRYRGLLVSMFSFEAMTAGGDAFAGLFRGLPGDFAWYATHIGNFATYAGNFLLIASFTTYLSYRLDERDHFLIAWSNVTWVVSLVMCAFAALGLFYHIDASNLYHRSDFFWLSLLFVGLVGVVNFVLVLVFRKNVHGVSFPCLLFYTIAPIGAAAFQYYVYGLNASIVVGVIGLMVVFLELQMNLSRTMVAQSEELARSRVEVSESRIAVMVSQIQPHFLFNTLDSIYYLCDEDPKRAKQAVDKFSTYLRANLDSLNRSTPVPIEAELSHVRTYLELEKISMEELLDYEINCEATGFSVPALSIQTLAENAVKHGVSKRPEGGKVVVNTREDRGSYRVEIVDDGVGFDLDGLDRPGHLGLENTRMRLEAMCNGKMEIDAEPDRGVTVVMRIPKEAKK